MAYINDLFGHNQDLVQEFRERISDVLPQLKTDFHRHDLCLFKYIVARDFDLDKAEEMIREHLKWREDNKIDHIFEVKMPEGVEDSFPVTLCGTDKNGCPVIYQPIGKWKWRKVIKNGWKHPLKQCLWQRGERLVEKCAQMTSDGQPVVQNYAIFDMEGYDYTQIMSIELNRLKSEIFKDYLDNFPEVMSAIRIINAPKMFQIIWSWLEPILTGRTASKIEIYGCNKEQWKARLLEEVGPENLPSHLGGSLTACRPYKVNWGIQGLPKYENLGMDKSTQIQIPAGQKKLVSFHLQANDRLSWNFKTQEHDIGFGLELNGKEMILENARVDSHKFVQKGLIDCERAGCYSLSFDNTFSKFKAKTVHLVAVATKN